MASGGCVEKKSCAGGLDISAKSGRMNGMMHQNGVLYDHSFQFDHSSPVDANDKGIVKCLGHWNGGYVKKNKVDMSSAAPLTLCAQKDQEQDNAKVFRSVCDRRTFRIERAGSTESVAATSGGESCQSSSIASDNSGSEPSSPSRPVTPQPMPPVPAHLTDHCPYECLRADSEDSGLGPSPAKSSMGPTSPLEGYVSPIQYDDEPSDSLLDLTTATVSRKTTSYLGLKDKKDSSFLPFAVSKLMVPVNDVCHRPSARVSENGFRFRLPQCSDLPPEQGLDDATQDNACKGNVSRFKFLVNSDSHHSESVATVLSPRNEFPDTNCPESLSVKCEVLPATPVDEGVNATLCQTLSSSANDVKPLQFPSNVVDDDAKYARTTGSLNHQVPLVQANTDDSVTDFHEHDFLDPQVALVSDFAAQVVESKDCDESRQSSCGDASQDRSELCHDLTSDCTSSSCSQAANDVQSVASDDTTCKWLNCDQKADANTNSSYLLDHLRKCHAQPQFNQSSYVCLWVGCKVFERPSSSRSWLERHLLLHGGNKPFRCIVDGCHQRFGTEGALQRHVNSHFPQSSRNGKGGDNGLSNRLLKRKKHLHKYRRRPHSVKTNDFFDDGIMEHVRHRLFELSSIEGMDHSGPPAAITFQSTIIGRRAESSGKTKVLLHWNPEDMLPDCWVSEEAAMLSFEKTIPISSLPPETLVHLDPIYTARLLPRPGKRRRK